MILIFISIVKHRRVHLFTLSEVNYVFQRFTFKIKHKSTSAGKAKDLNPVLKSQRQRKSVLSYLKMSAILWLFCVTI